MSLSFQLVQTAKAGGDGRSRYCYKWWQFSSAKECR